MILPEHIDREFLLKAIDRIDEEGTPPHAQSTLYDVIHQGKRYPPKLVVSWASQFATGVELDREAFNGGVDTPCMRILANAGLAVERKVLLTNVEETPFFTTEEFVALQTRAGEKRDQTNDAQNDDWQILKDAYDKSAVWADILQKNIFTGGVVRVRRDPTNQASNFLPYNWARIYPCTSAKNIKKLAYTVGINEKSGFVIKIDTVGLEGSDRAIIEGYRDGTAKGQTSLEIPIEEGLALGWQGLIERSATFLRSLASHYEQLDQILQLNTYSYDSLATDSFFDVLQKFLYQEGDLSTSSYPDEHAELKLKVSFGVGNLARIPWIAFLAAGQQVSKGIYPVYLHYKSLNCLILAYGLSETNPSEVAWPNDALVTIKDYLKVNYGKAPDRYGGSYVYKVYDLNENLNPDTVNQDLASILRGYKQLMNNKLPVDDEDAHDHFVLKSTLSKPTEWLPVVCQQMASNGFHFDPADVANFYLSLRTKPFVILAGISGTGKTQIIRQFASALGYGDARHCLLIPVRPDWADNTDLIGYKNIQGEFEEQPLLKVMQDAMVHPNEPFFVILDEMNLARVEHYFSDFLSVMETRERNANNSIVTSAVITDTKVNDGKAVTIPQNLMIVGTVNMDETTHPFSRKVLDRANAVEMNTIDLNWLENIDDNMQEPVANIFADAFVSPYINANKDLTPNQKQYLNDSLALLIEINTLLEPAGLHFGYRVRDEIAFYLTQHHELGFETAGLMSKQDALDYQLMQKVLPRIQGSSMAVLTALLMLLKRLTGAIISQDMELKAVEQALSEADREAFPRSTRKIQFMLHRFHEDGYTSFWL